MSESGILSAPRVSYRDLLKEAETILLTAGVPDSALDAWYLMEDCFKISRSWYYLHGDEPVENPAALAQFRQWVSRRRGREPLQYILGKQEFMGLPFRVNRQVLIPRQDTEVLVELVLKEYPQGAERLLDMCTGSGCILLSLLKLRRFSYGCGVDRMEGALSVARENAKALGIKADFVVSDLFSQVPASAYDVIVCNPPYVTGEEMKTLEPEVKEFEPDTALYAPENGLAFYRRLAEEVPGWLVPGGRIYMEIGCKQGPAVRELFAGAGFQEIVIYQDLAGLDRVVRAGWR